MKNKSEHVCSPYFEGCACDIQALEPDENCQVHGHPSNMRCACGKFVKKELMDEYARDRV